jgi:hypothetical protein
VFVGTRVPAQALLDYLEGGETIDEFLDDFPTVSREQVIAFLEEAGRALLPTSRSGAFSWTKTFRGSFVASSRITSFEPCRKKVGPVSETGTLLSKTQHSFEVLLTAI